MRTLFRYTLLIIVPLACLATVRGQDRPVRPPAKELKALEWMLGSWKHDAEGMLLQIDCKKSGDGHFLERTFRLKLGQGSELTLRQFIGWNPTAKRIQSWAFGSDGSIETGTWSKEGNTWQHERSITYADGKKGSAINLATLIDEDSLTFKSVERYYGEQLLPEIMDMEVERRK